VIYKILIYFPTKTEPIVIESKPRRRIRNACERGAFYAILFSNHEYLKFPITHIYQIKEFRG
jgi:hypothetical protein